MKLNFALLKPISLSVLWILFSFHTLGCQAVNDFSSSQKEIQVLFVGNSLTYFNDLPQLVRQNAKKQNIRLKVQMIAYPNWALTDHWASGEIQRAFAKNKFDYLVIQQGPSSQSDGRKMLMEYGALFKQLCDENNTQLAFFMVWPAVQHFHTFDGVIQNYADAAAQTQSLLFPVGQVWKKHIDETDNWDFYNEDQFHSSLKGSQVAAEIIFQYLLNHLAKHRSG